MDALMSVVPLLLMLMFLMDAMSLISHETGRLSRDQDVFDRLVSIADHTVKSGAARHEGDVRYPNWVEEGRLTESYSEDLRERAGLSRLAISLDGPEGHGACIYRIVVVGESKRISRLFVCGG